MSASIGPRGHTNIRSMPTVMPLTGRKNMGLVPMPIIRSVTARVRAPNDDDDMLVFNMGNIVNPSILVAIDDDDIVEPSVLSHSFSSASRSLTQHLPPLEVHPVPIIHSIFPSNRRDGSDVTAPVAPLFATPHKSLTLETSDELPDLAAAGPALDQLKDATIKPHIPFASLITMAILDSKSMHMTVSEIYDWMKHNFPYFATSAAGTGWKNSVRHNLSLNNLFVKQNRGDVGFDDASSGKGSYWRVRSESIPLLEQAILKQAKCYQRFGGGLGQIAGLLPDLIQNSASSTMFSTPQNQNSILTEPMTSRRLQSILAPTKPPKQRNSSSQPRRPLPFDFKEVALSPCDAALVLVALTSVRQYNPEPRSSSQMASKPIPSPPRQPSCSVVMRPLLGLANVVSGNLMAIDSSRAAISSQFFPDAARSSATLPRHPQAQVSSDGSIDFPEWRPRDNRAEVSTTKPTADSSTTKPTADSSTPTRTDLFLSPSSNHSGKHNNPSPLWNDVTHIDDVTDAIDHMSSGLRVLTGSHERNTVGDTEGVLVLDEGIGSTPDGYRRTPDSAGRKRSLSGSLMLDRALPKSSVPLPGVMFTFSTPLNIAEDRRMTTSRLSQSIPLKSDTLFPRAEQDGGRTSPMRVRRRLLTTTTATNHSELEHQDGDDNPGESLSAGAALLSLAAAAIERDDPLADDGDNGVMR